MKKDIINTTNAPQAIGSYSQAVRTGHLIFVSGQIPLDPQTGEIVNSDFSAEAKRVFDNVAAIAEAAGLSLSNVVKLTVYLTDLNNFATLNEIMAKYFDQPFPARAAVQVSLLPRGATVEVDAILAVE